MFKLTYFLISIDMFTVDYVEARYKDRHGNTCKSLNDISGSNGVKRFGGDNESGWCLIWNTSGGGCWDVNKRHCYSGYAGYVVEMLCETRQTTMPQPLLCNDELHTGTPFISMLLLAVMALEAVGEQTQNFVAGEYPAHRLWCIISIQRD